MKQLKKWSALLLVLSLLSGLLVLPTFAASGSKDEDLKVMVLSDIHVLESDLISDTKTYQDALVKNLKMFSESEAIFAQEVERVKEEQPDVLLISGDLTKDGEVESHKSVASKLNALKKAMPKLKIYVTPGNHDIRNKNGYNYTADTEATRTDPEDFRDIYSVTYQDESIIATYKPSTGEANGLSYVARLDNGYTIISVDSCCYSSDNTDSGEDEHETRGNLSAECRAWVLEQIAEANDRGDTVIGMTHHGVVEHFTVEHTILGDFLMDNYEEVATEWADAGMHYVFTGHQHSNDVAQLETEAGNVIYDMETGSAMAHPCPTRIVTFTEEGVEGKTILHKSLHYYNPQTKKMTSISDLTTYSNSDKYGISATMLDQWVKGMLEDKVGTYPASVQKLVTEAVAEFFAVELAEDADVQRVLNYVYYTSMSGDDHGDNPEWYNEAIEKASTGYLVNELVRILNKHLAVLGADVIFELLDAILPENISPLFTWCGSYITVGPVANGLLTDFILEICDSMTNDQNFVDDNDFKIVAAA